MSIKYAYAVPHPPLIIPQVGRGEEKGIAATVAAYEQIAREVADVAPDTVIIVSPHAESFRDYFHISPVQNVVGTMKQFGAGDVSVQAETDLEFVRALADAAEQENFPAGTRGGREGEMDHGTMIPLYFINQRYTGYKLVMAGISGLPHVQHYRLGMLMEQVAEQLGRKTVFIASGDLSHRLKADGPYGFAQEGPVFDRQVTSTLASGDFGRLLNMDGIVCENAGECGLRSFIMLAGALDGKAVESKLLSYEGPFGVGYGVASFRVTGNDPARHFLEGAAIVDTGEGDAYVRLARQSLETYLKTGKVLQRPDGLPAEMDKAAGIFVSLKKHGNLRGCIGMIETSGRSIADEIIRYAVVSATEDPRFPPVQAAELPELEYSIDVLGKPEPISSTDELDVKKYGVIVTEGYKRGVLLPNLEGVDTPHQQVEIALAKAGIGPHDSYSMERFQVERHK